MLAAVDLPDAFARGGIQFVPDFAVQLGHSSQAALHAGTIDFDGTRIERLAPFRRARLGIGFVPQEREIFPSLTVEENLTVAAKSGRWSLDRIYDLFPNLAERRRSMGNQLSGGEQQMLSIGRALMLDPSLLLLDEPLEGLAPVVVDRLLAALTRIRDESGAAIVLVEQHARLALEFSDERDDSDEVCYGSTWIVVMNESTRKAHEAHLAAGKTIKPPPGFRIWTDSFSNLMSVLRTK